MKSKDKKNISYHLNEYDFKKLKLKFLDKDYLLSWQNGMVLVDAKQDYPEI